MKGNEIINRIIRKEMPDIEAVRATCHNREAARQAAPPARVRWSTAVATIIACVFFTTAVVAAYQFGSFDRLRGIIGDEAARQPTP